MAMRLLKIAVYSVWFSTITLLLLLAVYVSLGQVMMPQVHQYRGWLEQTLSDQTGTRITIRQLTGSWNHFQPQIELADVALGAESQPPISVQRVTLQLNVLASLSSGQPVFSKAQVAGVRLAVQRTEAGHWHVPGLPSAPKTSASGNPITFLWAQRAIELRDVTLRIQQDTSPEQSLIVEQLDFQCLQQQCAFTRPRVAANQHH